MRLLWLTNIPSPYRVDFFNELGRSLELTVLFERFDAADRDDSWQNFACKNFKPIFMRGIRYRVDSAVNIEVLKHVRDPNYDAVIITNFSSPTGALAITYLKMLRRPYFLESDGGFPSGSRLKSWVKRKVIGGASGYFSTSDVHDNYYRAYGAEAHQLIRYPFSSVRHEDLLEEPPSIANKLAAKRELGIRESRMVLTVGRFIHSKGFDVLLEACASLPEDTAVCIVGGDPTADYNRLVRDLGLAAVYFAEFKARSELTTYFLAADIFVLPTRGDAWGLVINEALAHGLPVITTDRCIAGLELVAKNFCGTIVPAGDSGALASAIGTVLEDEELRRRMQRSAISVGRNYTIERMAKRHEQVLHQYPSQGRRLVRDAQ